MKITKTYKFMHTIDGQPASYQAGEQICFATQSKRGAVTLVDSIQEIKQQQALSAKWRRQHGFEENSVKSWVRVLID